MPKQQHQPTTIPNISACVLNFFALSFARIISQMLGGKYLHSLGHVKPRGGGWKARGSERESKKSTTTTKGLCTAQLLSVPIVFALTVSLKTLLRSQPNNNNVKFIAFVDLMPPRRKSVIDARKRTGEGNYNGI